MANKTVLSTFGFSFSTTLTLLHTVTTMGGMSLFAYCGLFTPKTVPTLQVRSSLPLLMPCLLVLSACLTLCPRCHCPCPCMLQQMSCPCTASCMLAVAAALNLALLRVRIVPAAPDLLLHLLLACSLLQLH